MVIREGTARSGVVLMCGVDFAHIRLSSWSRFRSSSDYDPQGLSTTVLERKTVKVKS
jgi:hypothetical protein